MARWPAPVFVTGASGFLGGALTRALVADGIEVRALARSDASAAKIEGLGAVAGARRSR